MEIKAHFDGKVFVPDEPVSLETGQAVTVTTGRGDAPMKTAADVLTWLREEHEPAIWEDVGDSVEFAAELRRQSNTPRYKIEFD